MKIKNYIKTVAIALTALAVSPILNAMTDQEKEYLKLFGRIIAEQSNVGMLELNDEELAQVIEGIKDFAKGAPMPENIQEVGQKMGEYLTAKAEAVTKKTMEKTLAEVEAFWKKLSENKNVLKTPSGLAYEIIAEGTAPLPVGTSDVTVKYEGSFIDGKVFDSSKNAPEGVVTFNLGKVIKGFSEGLQKVGKGGKIRLYIPAELGYGMEQQGPIPGGSTLIFDVEMINITNEEAAK